jgi:hypothetical protein
MKKLHNLIGIAIAFLFAGTATAQPNNFFRLTGNYDHGTGRKVIQSIDPANPGYLIAGTARTPLPGNAPAVFLSAFNPAANPLWTMIYPINNGMPAANTIADGMGVAAAPALARYGVLAYTNFTAPAQSVLFQVNLIGNPVGITTPLGDLRATWVVWDAAVNCFVVLGQSPTNNGDMQIIVVNAGGGIVWSNAYDSGPGFADTPSRLMIDPATGNYTAIGTSFNGVDNNVFLVRATKTGGLVCNETIGNPGIDEFGVDITYGKNVAGNPVDVALGMIRGSTITPFVIEINPLACPGYNSAVLLNPAKPYNVPTGITTNPANYDYAICGLNRDANTNGFIAVINNAYAPITYARYGQPFQPGEESLNDIIMDQAAGFLVTTGEHQLINPWPGMPTPPNEYFNWLLMTNTAGIGMCPDVPGMTTVRLCLQDIVYPFQVPFFTNVPISLFRFGIGSLRLNECANPFRMGDEIENGNDLMNGAIFPNPASTSVAVKYETAPTDQPVLEVTNMLGEIVLKQELASDKKTAEIDVSNLAPGAYIFTIRNGDAELLNEQIMINR